MKSAYTEDMKRFAAAIFWIALCIVLGLLSIAVLMHKENASPNDLLPLPKTEEEMQIPPDWQGPPGHDVKG